MRKIIIVLILCFTLISCATVISNNISNVGINSHPQKANIRITDKNGQLIFVGKTPVIVPLKSTIGLFNPAEYYISFSKDSFQKKAELVKAGFNWWSAFNFVLPFILIDAISGNMFQIHDVYLKEELMPEAPVIKYDELPQYYHTPTK